jgi:DNA-3-methyladenine glycosylase II
MTIEIAGNVFAPGWMVFGPRWRTVAGDRRRRRVWYTWKPRDRSMKIVLAVDGPLDVEATLARYRIWGEDPSNRLAADAFRRVLRVDDRLVPYEVRWTGSVDDGRLVAYASGRQPAAVGAGIEREVRRVFGLDFDLPGFYRFAKSDAALAAVVERLYGLRPTLSPTPLEMFVGSITAQQVNLAFAFALRARVVRRYGTRMAIGGHEVYAFPEAARLARVRAQELRALQFSERKAEYVIGIAREIATGALDLDALSVAVDREVIDRLTAIRGFGRWTADWFLARCLGRGPCCPAGDLGVRKAFEHYYGRGRSLSEKAIRRRAAPWGEYQNLAIHYLLVGLRTETRASKDLM